MTEYSHLYDASVPDWPDELAFFHELTQEVIAQQGAVLEVACGTGRVAVRLAHTGVRVIGLDRSADLLAGAKVKSAGLPNVRCDGSRTTTGPCWGAPPPRPTVSMSSCFPPELSGCPSS